MTGSVLQWVGLGRIPLPGEKRRVRAAEREANELLDILDEASARPDPALVEPLTAGTAVRAFAYEPKVGAASAGGASREVHQSSARSGLFKVYLRDDVAAGVTAMLGTDVIDDDGVPVVVEIEEVGTHPRHRND